MLHSLGNVDFTFSKDVQCAHGAATLADASVRSGELVPQAAVFLPGPRTPFFGQVPPLLASVPRNPESRNPFH